MSDDPREFTRFVHRDKDGSYLIWPYGMFGWAYRSTYQQRDQFTRILRAYTRASALAIVAIVVLTRAMARSLEFDLGIAAVVSVIFILIYGFAIGGVFRGSKVVRIRYRSVPRSAEAKWDFLVDSYSIWALLTLAVVCGFFFIGCLLLVGFDIVVKRRPPQNEVVVGGLLFGAATIWLVHGLWRWRKRRLDLHTHSTG